MDPSQKTLNFRTPQKWPKGGTSTPKGAKGCPKGSILYVFLVAFWDPVPTVKTVFSPKREPRFRGSRVPQNSKFLMIVWSLAKRASRESLLEDFLRFGWIFEDFWVPLGLPFRAQASQVRAQNHFSKKGDFLEARWRNPGTPRLGSYRNCEVQESDTPSGRLRLARRIQCASAGSATVLPNRSFFPPFCSPRRSFPLHFASQIAPFLSILHPGCPRHQF